PGRSSLALVHESLAFGRRLAQELGRGAVANRSAHAFTVSSDQVSVTGAGSRVTRSTSNASERREVPISIVMSTTPTSTASTLSRKTPYPSGPTHSAGIVAVTSMVHIVRTRKPIAAYTAASSRWISGR